MMFDSIRTKLTLWYIAIVAAFVIPLLLAVYLLVIQNKDRDINSRLEEMARSFVSASTSELGERASRSDQSIEDAISETADEMRFRDYQFAVYRADGEKVISTGEIEYRFSATARSQGFEDLDIQGKVIRSYKTKLSLGGKEYFLMVFHSLEEKEAITNSMRYIFSLGLPITLIFAAIGGYFFARKSLSPVVEMSRRAKNITTDNLNERIPIKNARDEVGELASVMNDLLARLERSFEQQRQFMADASHELRTPIAIIRSESEVAIAKKDRSSQDYLESLATVHDESERLSKIVEDLMIMARADSGHLKIARKPVYLDEIVGGAVRSISVLARKRNIDLRLQPSDEMPMTGDEPLLDRVFRNICENGVKYGREGGFVQVECSTIENCYRVKITDNGSGVPKDERAQIFERFYRVDRARIHDETLGGGAGLGLAIAKWIVEAHTGNISLSSGDVGGSVFTIDLPRI